MTVEDLDLRYAGAHGVAAADSDHIIVRRLDLSWIGGSNQAENSGASATPIRYGNAVQFYANMSDSFVEGCRIFEIYDTGVTNQYSGTTGVTQKNITYRFNTIWNVGLAALEVWVNAPSTISDVQLDHNTCFNAGAGWARSGLLRSADIWCGGTDAGERRPTCACGTTSSTPRSRRW